MSECSPGRSHLASASLYLSSLQGGTDIAVKGQRVKNQSRKLKVLKDEDIQKRSDTGIWIQWV